MKPATDSRTPASFSVVGPTNGMLKITLYGDWAAPWDVESSAVLKDAQSYLIKGRGNKWLYPGFPKAKTLDRLTS